MAIDKVMKYFSDYFTIIDAFAITASVLSFLLALLHLWKGLPYEKVKRRTQVKIFLFLALFLSLLTAYLGSRYKSNLQVTLEQTGFIKKPGIYEIYYPVPYCSNPYLKFEERTHMGSFFIAMDTGQESSFKLLEQKNDFFKLELFKKSVSKDNLEYPIGIEWKSIGKINGCDD